MVEIADSLDRLRTLLRLGGTITQISESPIASNGLPYCYVEITDTEGTHFIEHMNRKHLVFMTWQLKL